MIIELSQLQEISTLVKSAAQNYILPKYQQVMHGYKDDGSLITEVDLNVQNFIRDELRQRYPQIDMLAEEMTAEQHNDLFEDNQSAIWCLDPLDGTRNFSSGVAFFSISLALIVNREINMGLVYDPLRDECFCAIKDKGAWLNGDEINPTDIKQPLEQTTAIIDFKRLPASLAKKIALSPPYSSQRSFGSVALDWCYLAMGRCHLYLHGQQNLWDYAAGYLIFNETMAQTGAKHSTFACTLDGEDVYNRTLAKRSAVAAINQTLFDQWAAYLSVNKN